MKSIITLITVVLLLAAGSSTAATSDVQQSAVATAPSSKLAAPALPGIKLTVFKREGAVSLVMGKSTAVGSTVMFAYATGCTTSADISQMAHSVASTGSTSGVADIQAQADARPAHTPAPDENVSLRNGVFEYELHLKPGLADATGAVPVTITGNVYGPTNYDPQLAGQCGGYRPTFAHVDLKPTTVLVKAAKTEIDLPVIGTIGLRLNTK